MAEFSLKDSYLELFEKTPMFLPEGFVSDATGLIIEGTCPGAGIGSICEISADKKILAEVTGFRNDKILMMPYEEAAGIRQGAAIRLVRKQATFRVSDDLIGRIIDGLGRPIDDKPELDGGTEYRLYSRPLNPMRRERITKPLDLGIRAINSLLTVGKGQRLSVMAGSGVGKSVLMSMIARSTKADVNVIALVGERGREVREFIEESLGPEGLKRSIVICATSDVSPVLRMRAAFVATTIAEHFRAQSKDVLLMMDSVTRFAMAQREVGLASGEPPTTKGYPPSVFAMLPRLFERAGNLTSGGSITGIYTVLTEADDINDVIGDTVRSIVDGHIVLSRKLASKNHFPAIDVPLSSSRVMPNVVSSDQVSNAAKLKKILAVYAEAEDLINIGAYVKGSNPEIDEAIQLIQPIREFLKQGPKEIVSFADSFAKLKTIFDAKANPKGAGA